MSPSGSTVLVIDDDEGLLILAQRRLQRHGYQVCGATTIAQARKLVQSSQIDLLVIDFQLDENLTGLDFYRELLAQDRKIPAVMCSGFSDDDHLQQARRVGIAAVLPKSPDYLEQLPALVQRILVP